MTNRLTVLAIGFFVVFMLSACSTISETPDAGLEPQITNGQRDNGEHPYVGALLFVQDNIGYYSCTGTLLSPTVMLTAGHCLEGASGEVNQVTYVRFEEEALAGIDDYDTTVAWLDSEWILAEEVIPHPLYDNFSGFPDTYDVGLVILSEPVYLDTYGELVELGYFDETSRAELKHTLFEAVGYGALYDHPVQSNKPLPPDDFARYKAVQSFITTGSATSGDQNVMFTSNPGRGRGGTCFGDSGGPHFINDTNVIVAITSYGIAAHCKGNEYDFRTDTQITQDFVNQYLE